MRCDRILFNLCEPGIDGYCHFGEMEATCQRDSEIQDGAYMYKDRAKLGGELLSRTIRGM